MADSVTVSVEGIPKLLKDIDKYDGRIRALVANELKASAQIIVRNAKRAAPKDQGALASDRGVNYKKAGELLFEIVAPIEYAGFVEFGTRRKRKIPAEVQKIGFQFVGGKKSGTAEQALRFITAWVKRKGIKFQSAGTFKSGKKKGQQKNLTLEQTAYIIFHFIMLNGIKPQPFFFPAVFAETPLLEKRIQMILNKTNE